MLPCIRTVRVPPRGYDPIVGELRSRSFDPYTTIITCHATDYELLSFQSGGGTIRSIQGKNERERKKQRHMFNNFERSFSAPLSSTNRREEEEGEC